MVLTRDGRFSISDSGQLISARGYPILDAGGAPIQLDPRGGDPVVGADGVIFQQEKQVASIGLFSADVSKGYLRYSNSGVTTTDSPHAITDRSNTGVAQGYVEQSNVNGIREMTRLIEVNRAFESITALTSTSESSLDEAIKLLGSK